jgi:hypothetical protein
MISFEEQLREHGRHESRLIAITALWTAIVLCAAGSELIERVVAAIAPV